MEHKTRTKALSWLLSLALALSLLPGMSLTAFAATLEDTSTTWSEDSTITDDTVTISGGVTVSANMTLTIPEGKTLTVNGTINATGHTLTVEGEGTLVVKGKDGSDGAGSNSDGGDGGDGITGNLVVNGATVQVTGGSGGNGGSKMVGTSGTGGNGGNGVTGNVTVSSGSATVTGGSGGKGGDAERAGKGGKGGNGGNGVTGNVTVSSGSATVTGGSLGSGGTAKSGRNGDGGSVGAAVTGTITGSATESDDGNAWAAVSDNSSTKQYVKVEAAASLAHTHDGITFAAWTSATSLPTESGNWYLTKDVTIESTWTVPSGTTNLCLNGYGIRYSGSGNVSVINVANNTLNLYDCPNDREHYITLTDGRGTAVANSGTESATCVKVTGGYITGGNSNDNRSGGHGGCVRVIYGTFTMNGGTIIGNIGIRGGGVSSYGTFTMNGGSITGNSASYGGGVYVDKYPSGSSGTFTMSGGSITGNTASDGGGVYCTYASTFNLSANPTIENNTANNVYLKSAHATKTDTWYIPYIVVADALSNTTPIGVAMDTPRVFTSDSTDALKASDYAEKFTSDDSAYSVAVDGKELKLVSHTHSFAYAASGAVITATCGNHDGCPLASSTYQAKLTIAAPEHTNVGDGKSAVATITDANNIKGEATVSYYAATKSGTAYTKTGDVLGSAPDAAGNYVAEITVGGVTAFVGYTIDKAAASVATPPTAKELTANGTAQELVNAGTAEGGTMRYVLGTNATTAPTTGWSADIPTGTEAGSYYMWYKAAGDADHSDSAAACVTVTVSAKKHSVTATLTTQTVAPVTLKLMQGKDNKATENVSVYTVSADTTVYTYSNTFSEVEDGVYNIVATQTIDGAERTVTSAVALTSADGDPTVNATMPDAKVNSVLEVKDGAPAAVVKGLDAEAVANAQTGSTVTYKMEVDDTTTANADAAKVNTEAQKIVPTGKALTITFMDITITKTTTPDGGSASEEPVHQTSSVIETIFSYEQAAPGFTVWMWRNHLDAVTKLTQLAAAPTSPADGTYWVDKANHLVHLFGSGYSVYAIGYVEGDNIQPVTTTTTTTTTTGGGSSGSTVTVPVSGDSASVSVSASVSGTTATVKAPTTAQLAKVIGESVKTGDVTIDVSGLNKDIATVSIPTETVKAIEKAVSDPDNDASALTVKLSDGSVTFDATALAAIAQQAKGSTIQLNLDNIGESKLKSAQKTAIKDMDVQAVYDAYITSNGRRISDFKGGKATVTVSYTLKDGQTGRGVVVWYVAEDGDKSEVPTAYSSKEVTFTVEHFSNYVIAYDAARAAACPKDDTCPISAFSDADPTAWYHDGVHYVLENGIMSGYGNGLFGPGNTTSRAMMAQILWNMEGKPVVNYALSYTDVDADAWYAEAVRWATAQGIMNGYGGAEGGKFGPNDDMTREQLVTIMYRYAQYKGVDVSVGEDTNILSYDDAFDVSEWAIPAMQWAVGNGLISGRTASTLNPKDTATRAEIATIIMRYCEEIAK